MSGQQISLGSGVVTVVTHVGCATNNLAGSSLHHLLVIWLLLLIVRVILGLEVVDLTDTGLFLLIPGLLNDEDVADLAVVLLVWDDSDGLVLEPDTPASASTTWRVSPVDDWK